MLGVRENRRRGINTDINPQGTGESSGSHADFEPGSREVVGQLLQAKQLRREERLARLGVKPRIVARGLAFEYLDLTQGDASWVTL